MFYYSWKKDRKSIYLFQSFSIEKMHTYSSITYQLHNYELFIFTKTTIYRESKAVKIGDFLGRKLYTDMSKNSSSTYVAAFFFTENFRLISSNNNKKISLVNSLKNKYKVQVISQIFKSLIITWMSFSDRFWCEQKCFTIIHFQDCFWIFWIFCSRWHYFTKREYLSLG